MQTVILASGSATRAILLTNAGVPFEAITPRVDEETVKTALLVDRVSPRDIADALSEMKSVKISQKHPSNLVIGCDQVLDHDGVLLSKPQTRDDAFAQLTALRNSTHKLHSSAVICREGRPVWRHISTVRIKMRDFSDAFVNDYIDRNWDSIQDSVGCYKLEEEGVQLMKSVQGDYFAVLGLPLLPLLAFLTDHGVLDK